MIFSSAMFLFRFLPVFFILYFLAPLRMKNIILLLGSLFFYAWGEPVYVILLLFLICSDYCHGRLIGRRKRKSAKSLFLCTSLFINLLVLGFFKYADWIVESVNRWLGTGFELWELSFPMGISFYTFRSMSYIIDCYRGKVKVQTSLFDYAMYVCMFPLLPMGPIVRYAEVEEQLRERKPDIIQISYGCRRFIIGLAKKALLADNLGLLWMEVSSRELGELTVLTAWLGILAFGLQIYFEFSGFADMAIGLGACLGFTLPENFNYPYIADSVSDFWSRWNMTLTGWFREYVYLPLGGKKKGVPRRILNIFIVWGLIGIWHGAGIRFLVWGLWFAFWIVLEKLFLKRILRRLPGKIGNLYTLFLVVIGWVMIGISQGRDALGYLGVMFGKNSAGLYNREALYLFLEYILLLVIGAVGATPLLQQVAKRMSQSVSGFWLALYRVLEKLVLPVLLIATIAYIVSSAHQPILYFLL